MTTAVNQNLYDASARTAYADHPENAERPCTEAEAAVQTEIRGMPAELRLRNRKNAMRHSRTYLIAAILVAAFGAVYESFSFGVFSFFMIYAFAFPLVLGAFPWLWIAISDRASAKNNFPPLFSVKIWNAGIATMTVGFLFRGVLDIYGTSSYFTKYYFTMGTLLLLTGLMSFVGYREKKECCREA